MKAPASFFIKEPGKAKQFSLKSIAPSEVLRKLEPAEILSLKIKGNKVLVVNSQGNILGEVAEENSVQLLKAKKKLIPIFIGRQKKILEILVIAEETLFREDWNKVEYRPFTRYINEETPEIDLSETGEPD